MAGCSRRFGGHRGLPRYGGGHKGADAPAQASSAREGPVAGSYRHQCSLGWSPRPKCFRLTVCPRLNGGTRERGRTELPCLPKRRLERLLRITGNRPGAASDVVCRGCSSSASSPWRRAQLVAHHCASSHSRAVCSRAKTRISTPRSSNSSAISSPIDLKCSLGVTSARFPWITIPCSIRSLTSS